MKTLGIIAEYNPFHNGHLYHLQASKEATGADFVVAVMSGNFMQRGTPAFCHKWQRAKAAVDCGIDLVLELPTAFAVNNAEYFAKGGVDVLSGLGCVDFLSFGSEAGTVEHLQKTAKFLAVETGEFKEALKAYLDKGLSYPKARSEAVAFCVGREAANLLTEPNNILAVEYLKQLILTGSAIQPMAVKRRGTGYHDTETRGNMASASAIRQRWRENPQVGHIGSFLPEASRAALEIFDQTQRPELNGFYQLIAAHILRAEPCELAAVFAAGEGLENRLKKAVRGSGDVETLIDGVVSKRYTRTRINRLLIQMLLGLSKESFGQILKENVIYARVLAFNDNGAKLLRHIKNTECATIPIITNINKDTMENKTAQKLLQYDILASDLYNLALGGALYRDSDYVMKPYGGGVKKTSP